MPKTTIFSDSNWTYKHSTSYGSIEVQEKGDSESITFTDHDHNETKAAIKIHSLHKLKQTMGFNTAQEIEGVEQLVHKWKTRKSNNVIIKYSDDCLLAFEFSTEGNVDDDFNKLISGNLFTRVDYISEFKFEESLREMANLTISQLREIPGISEKRISLLLNNASEIKTCLKSGLTITQLAQMDEKRVIFLFRAAKPLLNMQRGVTIEHLVQSDMKKLENLYSNDHKFDNHTFKFVTIQQVLGIDHAPPAIDESAYNKLAGSYPNYLMQDHYNEFSFVITENTINVTDDCNSKFVVEVKTIEDDSFPPAEQLSTLKPHDMVHRWFTLSQVKNEAGQVVTTLFCPEMKIMHKETADPLFPLQELKMDYHGHCLRFYLNRSQYYKEIDFVNFLIENDTSIESLKAMPGMTRGKLETMLDHTFEIKNLLDEGITFADFAKADEKRFNFIITNFNKAKSALAFVDVQELFGLRNRPRRHSGLFDGSVGSNLDFTLQSLPNFQSGKVKI